MKGALEDWTSTRTNRWVRYIPSVDTSVVIINVGSGAYVLAAISYRFEEPIFALRSMRTLSECVAWADDLAASHGGWASSYEAVTG